MDWKGVGNAVIKAGAPLLGGALFGPAGSVIASIISGKFGVSPTPGLAWNYNVLISDPHVCEPMQSNTSGYPYKETLHIAGFSYYMCTYLVVLNSAHLT